ncbi:MAG: 3-dehydroquinate synthase [Longimicrobiales bacterium]
MSAWTVPVRTRDGGYPVMVGAGLLENIARTLTETVGARRYAVISDDNVAAIHGHAMMERMRQAGLDASLFTFPAGEASKTRKSWSILTDEMLEAGFGRDACVVAVGGGVTTDLAGFVAATYLRGIPVVQVPTSYLAMIDASVGGKTGVDAKAGKNLVGAFHPPKMVIADTSVLRSLPREERAQGLVEAFKHGAIMDLSYFEDLESAMDRLMNAEADSATEAVRRSVAIKAEVVGQDEYESGIRQILNFGHTLGHAIEAASQFEIGHGSAVAVGMLLEAELGEILGVTERGTRDRLQGPLTRLVGPSPKFDPDVVLPFLRADKKVRGGEIRVVFLRRVGETDPGQAWTRPVPQDAIRDFLVRAAETA